MQTQQARRHLAAALAAAAVAAAPLGAETQTETTDRTASRAAAIVRHLPDAAVRQVVAEALERNPELAAAAARLEAMRLRAPQVRALPDPTVALTLFLESPETRVGPQEVMAAVSQRLPWFGKLALRERAVLLEAAALEAELEARRLRLVTEVRRLFHELAFVERQGEILEEFRAHLVQHEEIARTRYATGVGLGQGVVKLQAELTRVENRLLELELRRIDLLARLNVQRDQPAAAALPRPALQAAAPLPGDLAELRRRALEARPELAAVAARAARADALGRLAERERRPDLTFGLTWTAVASRRDPAGRAAPPAGNGDDILGLQGGLTLPVRRQRLRAAVEEAAALRREADESRRAVEAGIEADLGELGERLALGWRQLRLLEDVLILQAEEALDLARAGYVAGTLGALDLLDAEHVLFEARTAVARAAADYAIYRTRLEGAIAGPLAAAAAAQEDPAP